MHDFSVFVIRIGHVDCKPVIPFPERLVEILFGQVEFVVDDLGYPLAILLGISNPRVSFVRVFKHTTMEHETIDSDFLVPGNAYLLKQILFVTECAYGGHEPAIAIPPLANIICGHAFDAEVRLVENILGKKVIRQPSPLVQDRIQGSLPGTPQSV